MERALYKSSPTFKLAKLLRTRLNYALKDGHKCARFQTLLGCTLGELKLYVENYFPLYPGMSWGNYGSEWHIDHFLPLSSFDLSEPSELYEAAHYTNLQPLWAKENQAKGARLPIH